MWAAVVGLSSSVIGGLVSFFSQKTVKTASIVALLIALISIIPFEIALPDEFVSAFEKGGSVYQLFVSMNYFVPVGYILNCFLIIFLLNYTHFFWGLFQKICSWFKDS